MPRAVLTLSILILSTLIATGQAAATTYLYRQTDGTLLHTDIPPQEIDTSQVTLLRIIRRAHTPTKASSYASRKATFTQCTGVRSTAMRERARAYEPTITELAQQHRVSKHLVMAVVAAESCFDKDAVSKAGAAGLMQLMPATARSLGVDDPFNHVQNLKAGIQYLSKLSEQFSYNHKLVLAAYNAGPGNVRKYKGIPPFNETRKYVTRVMANYLDYLQMSGE